MSMHSNLLEYAKKYAKREGILLKKNEKGYFLCNENPKIKRTWIESIIKGCDIGLSKANIIASTLGITADVLLSDKKTLEKTGADDTKCVSEDIVFLNTYPRSKEHRELIHKLIDILEGANRVNAKAIEQNINAFHLNKDADIPDALSASNDKARGVVKKTTGRKK